MRSSIAFFICLLSVSPCTAEVIVCFPMDSNPNWTTEGQWEFGVPQGGGGLESYDPNSGYTGANVYGYNLAGNYENDMPEYCLTTSALNCILAENVKLSFWRWLGVESSIYDHAKVQVSNDGANWTDFWVNGAGNLADTSWVYCEYDISAVADGQPTVFIRWCMGPTDFSYVYAGWNIDDVCLNGDIFAALFISPSDSFFSLGPEGGPFSPACKGYTLTNEDTSALNWTAEGTQSWLDAAPGGGTLAPGSSVAVKICINSTANTLSEGRYTDTVRFTNTNSGFSYSIDVTLYVYVFVGGEILVPLHFPTIQAAIDASSDGDTIVVLDGTYTGDGNRDIDFNGRAITLKSVNGPESCIIDCEGSSQAPHRGFYFHSGENSQSIVDGFTITGGRIGLYGAGIYCGYSSPTIRNCIITGNDADGGGGMYNDHSNPILTNCTFRSNGGNSCGGMYNNYSSPWLDNCIFKWNYATGYEYGGGNGGGMNNDYSGPTLTNCTFMENFVSAGFDGDGCGGGMANRYGSNATLTNCIFIGNEGLGDSRGAGMYNNSSNPTLINCTFNKNRTRYGDGRGGGIYNYSCKPTLTNCILWGNSDIGGVDESAQVHAEGVGGPFINYSCIQGLDTFAGHGNIGEDPCFADSSNDDYHLKSIAGRWNANSQSWVQDDVSSLCIDAGDPNSDWTAELWPHGKRINMGTYGGTPEASMSQLDIGNIANLDNDVSDIVNSLDLALFVGKWCYEELLLAEDLNRDGFVNFIDFAIFADNCELPPQGPLPGPASNPAPANGATEVDSNADLSWTAGLYAISHDVFFGTSNPPPFIHNQTATTFEPGTMAVSTMYYWRIDEVGAYGTTTGTVWRFTTLVPGPASNPEPANWATEVDPNADLSWTAGVHAISHDVFFGTTSNPPPFIHNQTATTFEPGTMAFSTRYYWRIDEVGAYGTVTGTVWSFQTLVSAHSASNPNPYNGQVGVTTTPVLNWTADPDATSHDVYFGTSNPPTFIRNQSATTFEPDKLDVITWYYWRIDEVGAYGTITGMVWIFKTTGTGPG